MPFKSKKQARFFFWKGKHSKTWSKRAKKWAAHTPDMKKLPESK